MITPMTNFTFSFLSTVMFLVFYYLGIELYKALGYDPARGISLGIGIEMLLISYFTLNTFTIFCSRLYLRITGACAFIIITFYLLWPYHPLRTVYLSFLGSLITILSCISSDAVAGYLSKLRAPQKND